LTSVATITKPIRSESSVKGLTVPAGTEITITNEYTRIALGIMGRVIIVNGVRHGVLEGILQGAIAGHGENTKDQ
jgi:hypothetical protein